MFSSQPQSPSINPLPFILDYFLLCFNNFSLSPFLTTLLIQYSHFFYYSTTNNFYNNYSINVVKFSPIFKLKTTYVMIFIILWFLVIILIISSQMLHPFQHIRAVSCKLTPEKGFYWEILFMEILFGRNKWKG